MTDKELLSALNHLKVETGSLACLGCGHEHNCGVKGCAILREAAARIEGLPGEGEWRITEYEFFDCSVCGNSYYTGAESKAQAQSYLNSGNAYKYCPGCGAKMKGAAE